MTDPSSRFQPVTIPQRAPGTCLLTGTSEGPFIDTGRDFGLGDRPRFAGRVYISIVAVREMAEQAGLGAQFRQWAEAEIDRAYRQGYQDGVKESVGSVDDLVEQLHATADRLGGLHLGPAAVEVARPADADVA